MNIPRWLLLLTLLVTACTSTKVNVDFDEAFSFDGPKTYAWREGIPAENELHQRRIVQAVDEALAFKGLRKAADGAAPDLFVETEVVRSRELRESGGNVAIGVHHYTGWGSVGIGGGPPRRVEEIPVGTLVIALIDAENERLVWRASSTRTFSNDDPQVVAEKIREMVEKSFEGYPPK